jgi:hypothetical protein
MLGCVMLKIDHEDEQGFKAARDLLLGLFTTWLARAGRPHEETDELIGDAGVALDWKWTYGDGELAAWRTGDIYEFLLDWCPRKLSVTQADCVTIPVALVLYFSFLDEEELLDPGSAPVDRLIEGVTVLVEEFVEAMGDRSKFGLAKSMFVAASDEGVDLTDPVEARLWMERFNGRPEEERHRLIPDSAFTTPPRRPSLPPVAVPAEEVVARSRDAAPILAMFRDLAAYVGDGRKLTQKGNLTLADARALVDLLGTGDVMDETIGDHTFRTTSSDNLYHLRQVFAWAKKAGVLRVVHGKVVATKQGLGLADGLAGSFDRAVDALMAIGPLTSQRFPDNWFSWPEVDKVLDQVSAHLLIAPYGAQSAFPLEDIAATATGVVLDAFSFQTDDDRVAKHVATDVSDIMDAFELAGLIRRIDTTDPGDRRRRSGGSVMLTPAGVVCVRRLLADAGYDTPTAGRFADASALELLGTDEDDFTAVYGELMAWRAARQPEDAAAQMADAVRTVDDPALANLGLAIMGEIGAEVAEPYVRELVSKPGLRGFALCWLVDEGLAGEDELFDPADVYGFADVLGQRMITGGPDSLVATLALVGDHGRQVETINRLWNAPSPVTDLVLAGISEVHSVKMVAKSARRALFKRRSSWRGT